MDIFGTKTTKNQLLRVKLLPKIIFRKFFTARKKKDFESLFTFRPISKQTKKILTNFLLMTDPPIGVQVFFRIT